MEKQLKVQELLNGLDVLEKLKDKSLPIKLSYQLARAIKTLREEKETYFQVIQELVEKYGERDENNNLKSTEDKKGVLIKSEYKQECFEQIDKIDKTLIKIELPEFSIEDFDGLGLTVDEVMKSEPILFS